MNAQLFVSIAFLISFPLWVIGFSHRLGFKAWLTSVSWIAFGLNSYSFLYRNIFFFSIVLSFIIYMWRTKWKFKKPKKKIIQVKPNPLLIQLKWEKELRRLNGSYKRELWKVSEKIVQLTKDNEKLKSIIISQYYDESPTATRNRMTYYANQSRLLQMKEKEKYLKLKESRLKEKDLFDNQF